MAVGKPWFVRYGAGWMEWYFPVSWLGVLFTVALVLGVIGCIEAGRVYAASSAHPALGWIGIPPAALVFVFGLLFARRHSRKSWE